MRIVWRMILRTGKFPRRFVRLDINPDGKKVWAVKCQSTALRFHSAFVISNAVPSETVIIVIQATNDNTDTHGVLQCD